MKRRLQIAICRRCCPWDELQFLKADETLPEIAKAAFPFAENRHCREVQLNLERDFEPLLGGCLAIADHRAAAKSDEGPRATSGLESHLVALKMVQK